MSSTSRAHVDMNYSRDFSGHGAVVPIKEGTLGSHRTALICSACSECPEGRESQDVHRNR